jgi:hypothetical protein
VPIEQFDRHFFYGVFRTRCSASGARIAAGTNRIGGNFHAETLEQSAARLAW